VASELVVSFVVEAFDDGASCQQKPTMRTACITPGVASISDSIE
jgi:hypothetical protein